MLPTPGGSGWIPNRTSVVSVARDVEIPKDAVKPEPRSGVLRPVAASKRARTRIVYRAVTSGFHDASVMTVADVLYPFAFAFRWGAGEPPAAPPADGAVARATALLRDRLVGLRVVKVDTETKDFGPDLKFTYQIPVVELYLDHASLEGRETAAIAPPWSTLPWHVLVLMEEAVKRGIAAFSESEARRLRVPWLDLARDAKVGQRLRALVDTFAAEGYVPEPLRPFVTVKEARARWEALRTFHVMRHHYLVTNGPYRLESWSADKVVLQVFRDLSYPLGVGYFNEWALPRRAFATAIDDRGNRLEIRADVEKISHYGRTFEIVREPLTAARPEPHDVPACRYVVVDAQGDVVRAELAPYRTGQFTADLTGLRPGSYTVLLALELGSNAVKAEVKTIPHQVSR